VQRQARELSSAYDASTAALRSQLAMEQARSDGLAAKQQEIVTLIDTQCADMLAKQQALGSENDTLRTQLKSLLGNYDKMQALLTQADGALTGERARTAAAVQALAAERAAREEQTTEFSAQLKTLTGEYKGYVSAMEEHRDALRASDARAVQSAGREKEWAARVTALTAHLKEQRDANAALTKDVGRLKELNATLLARIKQQQQQRSVVLAEPEVITVEEAKPAAATLDAAAV
jgi:chromosome segregation ATPase